MLLRTAHHPPLAVLAVAAHLLAAALPASADELRLENGDRLTGRAVALDDGTLTFETDWGGELAVAWSAVVSLAPEEPRTWVLEDASRLEAVALEGPAGSLVLRPSEAPPEADDAAPDAGRAVTVAIADVSRMTATGLPRVRYEGRAELGLVSSEGNTESESVVADARLVATRERDRYTLGAALHEASDDGRDTASRSTLHGSYDRFFSDHWYVNANARLTEDEFQDLDLRATVGVASGYRFWLDPERTLDLELGASLVEEDFAGGLEDSYPAGRWALTLALPLLPRIRLFHDQEGLLGLEDTDDLVWHARAGLRFTLFTSFVATTQLTLDYDRSPAPGRETTDRTLLFTLGYDW